VGRGMMLAPLLRFKAGAFADTLALMRSARLEAWPPKLLPSRCDRRWRRAIRCDGVGVVESWAGQSARSG
jgi:hypothetical protein